MTIGIQCNKMYAEFLRDTSWADIYILIAKSKRDD